MDYQFLLRFIGLNLLTLDVNENYQGKYIPGVNAQVVPPEYLDSHPVSAIVVFATGYIDSIMNSQKRYIENGGRFIRLIPDIGWV